MTNKDRLISLLGFAPPANSAEGALLDAGIVEASVYDGSNVNELKKVAIDIMKLLLTTPDTSNTLTGHETKYDRPSILKRITLLESELGLNASTPSIKGISPW